MENFQNLLLKLALLLLLLLVLAQGLLLVPAGRKFLSRTDRLEGRPWEGLAPVSQHVIN